MENLTFGIAVRFSQNHHSGVAETDAAISPQRKLGSKRSWYCSTPNKMRNAHVIIAQFQIFVRQGPFSWSGSHFLNLLEPLVGRIIAQLARINITDRHTHKHTKQV